MSLWQKDFFAYPEVFTREYVTIPVKGKDTEVYLDSVKSPQTLQKLVTQYAVKARSVLRVYGYAAGSGVLSEQIFEADSYEAAKAKAQAQVKDALAPYKKTDAQKSEALAAVLAARQAVIDESGLTEEQAVATGLVSAVEELQ